MGTDFLGYEVNSFYDILETVQYATSYRDEFDPLFRVDAHATETPYFVENVRLAIEAGVNKTGHNRYGLTDEVLELARERGTILVFLPNPNKTIDFPELKADQSFFEAYPIRRALQARVRASLGTDGADLYRGGYGAETHIAKMYGLTFNEFLQIARSDVQYLREQHQDELARRSQVVSKPYRAQPDKAERKPPSGHWLSNALDRAMRSELAHYVALEILRQHPRFSKFLVQPTGTWERFSIYQHSHMTLSRLFKYPEISQALKKLSEESLSGLNESEFSLLLSCHDIGKISPEEPDALEDKHVQLKRVSEVFETYASELPVNAQQAEFMRLQITHDFVADFIKLACPGRPSIHERGLIATKVIRDELSFQEYKETVDDWERNIIPLSLDSIEFRELLENTAYRIRNAAQSVDMDALSFFHYAKLLHACNASAFTMDAAFNRQRAFPSLDILFKRNESAETFDDPLFELDEMNMGFLYSERVAPAMAALQEVLESSTK